MKKFVLAGLIVVIGILSIGHLINPNKVDLSSGYPAYEGVEEIIVEDGMPVPGSEGVDEMIVGSEMPVPGLENVDEMIVGSEMPVPGLENIDDMIVDEEE